MAGPRIIAWEENPVIGTTISHYQVIKRLGEGGMGEVFLAEDLRLRRLVALKRLKPESASAGAARERLFQEARAASALNHPNLAVIYEVAETVTEEGPIALIALEYVMGESIADHVRRTGLDLDGILGLVRQIADGLGAAHARGIVHRDVKPSNLMVTLEGRVKILDFGLARMEPRGGDDDDATWTRDVASGASSGHVMGTVPYMSPEQALGREVDARADIFSLGVVVYELLAGRRPFKGGNAVAVLDAVLHDEPPPLPTSLSDPRLAAIERVIHKMLAKDRAERYSSLEEVCAAFAAAAAGAAPSISADVLESGPPFVAVLSFRNLAVNKEDAWLGTGIAESVIADLRGSGAVRVVTRERVQEALRRLNLAEDAIDEQTALRVGAGLGARFVVSGAFQCSADAVRVTAALFDTETGRNRATAKVDGRVSEIFDLQDRISDQLLQALAPDLGPQPSPGGDTHVVAAFEALSKGLLNLRLETHEALERAVVFFERAIVLDPRYVRAHVELGAAYSTKADYLAVPEIRDRAIAQFRKAIDLDSNFVRAWRDLGLSLVSAGRVDEGIDAVRRALTLSPEDPAPLSAMARALFIGKGDFAAATAYFARALALNPKAGWYWLQLSHCASLAGERAQARAAAEKAIAMQEASLSGHETIRIIGAYMRMGQVETLDGRDEEAVRCFRQELTFVDQVDHALRHRILVELYTRLGGAQHRLGLADDALVSLRRAVEVFETRVRLGADDAFTRYYAACAYSLLGNQEAALASLERAARVQPEFTKARARIEPELLGLRNDPAFRQLIG